MGKYKTWDEVPTKTRENLTQGLDKDAIESMRTVLLRTANAEKAVVEKKIEIKDKVKENQESLTEKEEMQKMLNDFRKEKSQDKVSSFLDGKEITDEEKENFLGLIEKGVDEETAYQSAAKESITVSKNQENLDNNEFGGKSIDLSSGTISADDYSQKAELALDSDEALNEFNSIDAKVIAGEVKVI